MYKVFKYNNLLNPLLYLSLIKLVKYITSGFKLVTSTFVLSILEFIFKATSNKHCAFTITYICSFWEPEPVCFLFRVDVVIRPRNLKTAANTQLARSEVSPGVLLHETAVHGC